MNAINLGRLVFVSDPSFEPPVAASADEETATVYGLQPTTWEDAVQTAGFPLTQPGWLPTPGMTLVQVEQLAQVSPVPAERSVRSVLLRYMDGSTRWATLSLSPALDGTIISTEDAWEGRIGSRTAVFFARPLRVPGSDEVAAAVVLCCMWEHGDLLVEIQSRGLTEEDLVTIGESLA